MNLSSAQKKLITKIPYSRNLRVSCCGVLKRYVQLHLRNPSLPGDYELISYNCNYSNFLNFFNTFLRYDLFFVEFNSGFGAKST